MAASFSSAADPSLHKYDVFISYRDATRNNFAGHLYSALRQMKITTYINDPTLHRGDVISRALSKAIEESAIAIIIFSEYYASCRWCLDEVVHILKCKKEKDQIVLPIFYGIDPSHIRHQNKTYAAAFVEHQERFKDKVQEWRQALTEATGLSGWDTRGKSESLLVQQVVEHVMGTLKSISSTSIDDSKGFVEDLSMAVSSSAVAVDPTLHKYDFSVAASSSSSAAAAVPRLPKFDVFISFRGEDTRKSFTSHLYSALCQKQIKVYIDDVSLEKGDDISPALPKAIKESAISIIIFSEDYASSRWCLDELVHILKCREEKDQIVLPVFYGIDPSHIRKQEGTYAAAFVKHQERFKDKMDKVQEWRKALTRAADLSGWDSQGKSESVLVQQVVEDVMRKLKSISSISIDDMKGLVGIRRQLCIIESLLCFDSPHVRILGIWGMGGIGKTTLARVVFKCFSNRFEGTCFLESVREQSQRKGLVDLEKEVFSKLLGEKDPDVSNPFVNVRLSRTKALLVLDDVDDFEQLERLAGDRDRFGPGSKIIVTSRDLQVLNQVIDVRYEVQALDPNEASQLFYLKAFKESSCRKGYELISTEVVSYTRGNPLALQVLGSYLKSLGIKEWESALEKLKRIPHVNIQKLLRISYDGLDTEEQDIFLDIACFLKGEKKDFVEGILGQKSIIAITVLVHKSLIIIDQGGLIRMHDLIQEMGREIVRQSTKKLGKPSRIWTAEDFSNAVESNKRTEAIEGIYLHRIKEDVHLRPDVFEEMCKLRLLKIYPIHNFKVYIDGDLKYLPNGLRYLHWYEYPGKSLPSNFKPQNLVELHMPFSNLEQLWDEVQELESLKHIDLQCSRLTKIPDLFRAPKLESINLSYCRRLIYNPSLILGDYDSLATRGNITKLILSGTRLTKLPSSIESLENLRHLNLEDCYYLTSLPKLPRNIEVLSLRSCKRLKRYPKNLCKLTRLQKLSLSGCSNPESFPMLLGVCSLTHLNLINCNIREIPDWLGCLSSLTQLYLGENSFDGIPASIGMLYKLKKLDIRKCKNLQSLPELPLFIESFNAKDCSSLEMVSTLRSTLTLGRWLDKYDSFNKKREFSFVNCTNLGEVAINNIFAEFLYKVFCTATTPREVVDSEGQRVKCQVVVCYPTKEIPRWFNNQSEGSSITITLPSNWYNPKTFLGFVVSVVVVEEEEEFEDDDEYEFEFEDEDEDEDEDEAEVKAKHYSRLECELHLMTNKDCFRVDVFKDYMDASCLDYIDASCADHIVMWYNYFDHSKANFEKCQEASLEFKSHLKVKRGGSSNAISQRYS